MSPRTIAMTDPLYDYLLRVSLREAPLLRRLREETAALGSVSNMQISPEQGQFMALLLRLTGARRVLEIGTFTGYSTLAMALALPPDGRIVACDVSRDWTEIARRYWAEAAVADRIDLRIGPGLATLDELAAAGQADSFDAAFIDADKGSYAAYYERCLGLLRPGGLIMIDNMLWDGRVADPDAGDDDTKAIRAVNALLGGDERVDLSLVPIGDGVALARKR